MIRKYKPNKGVDLTYAGQFAIPTLNKELKIWEYLRRFRSVEYCKHVLSKDIQPVSPNFIRLDTKANNISAMIVQSEEYFTAAKTASFEIRPLLLYYGMLGLAKCLIISGDNDYTLLSADVSNEDHDQHGLSTKVVRGNSLDRVTRDSSALYNEFCYVKNQRKPGLYSLFRRCYANLDIPDGTRITVKDLLSLFPESQKEYFEYFHEPPRTWECEFRYGLWRLDDSNQLIRFKHYDSLFFREQPTETLEGMLFRCFPELTTQYKAAQQGAEDRFTTIQEARSVDDHIYSGRTLGKKRHAFMKLNTARLCDLDVHFLLMFILSNIVRYRQDKWSNLIHRRENDEMFLVESFLEIASIKFPWLILRELEGKDYEFVDDLPSPA